MDRTSVAGICVLGVCLAGGAATDGYYWFAVGGDADCLQAKKREREVS